MVQYFENPIFLFVLLGIALLIGILSGLYPALVISGFKPIDVLKGKFSTNRKGILLRKSLVVFQFTVSVVLIAGTWIVYDQLNYVSNANLGFDKEQVIVLDFRNEQIRKSHRVLANNLRQNPNIKEVATSSSTIGMGTSSLIYTFESEGGGEFQNWDVDYMNISTEFLDVLGIQLKEGRNFSPKISTDTNKAVLVNETLVKKLGWKEALGKRIVIQSDSLGKPTDYAKVVGVIKDFHFYSLHQEIKPMMVQLVDVSNSRKMYIKVNQANMKETLAYIQTSYEKLDNKYPYEYTFLDQTFQKQYEADETRGQILVAFSILTILIACLGLLGLASFTAYQRRKEIGIRKVLGASVNSILVLLSRDFILLVFFASLIATPLAWYLMSQWLQDFAYRTTISPLTFVFASSTALLIALLTVSFQAWRTARVNPVEVLKDE